MFMALRLFIVATLVVLSTGSALAELSGEAMQARLAQLEPLTEQGYDIDGLRREAGYELQSLPVSERARLEAEQLYSRVQAAIVETYSAALQDGNSDEEALSIVREQVDADIEKFGSADLQQHIKAFSEDVLNSASSIDLQRVEFPESLLAEFAEASRARLETLSAAMDQVMSSTRKINKAASGERVNPSSGSGLSTASRGVRSYKTTAQMLKAMVSGDESERWVATANNSERIESGWAAEANIKVQPQFKFMGIVEVSAGPFVNASLTRFVQLDIKVEGLYPLTNAQGFFDLDWRGADGRPHMTNGAPQRRFVFFTCDASMKIAVDAGAGATLDVVGMGASASAKRIKTFETSYSSRRVLVPDMINGKRVGLAQLTDICHNKFIDARTPNGKTIRQNMRTSLVNMTRTLVLKGTASQCVRDNHCTKWFNERPRGYRLNLVPRCAQGGPGVMTCQTRGKVGASCGIVKNGKKLTVGNHPLCDAGLRCVQTREYVANYFDWLPPLYYAQGQCRR